TPISTLSLHDALPISEANNKETFLMSNMQPQTAKLNRQTWRFLEEYTRDEVRKNQEAYVIAGCYGDNGKIKNKVTIPTSCFKIVDRKSTRLNSSHVKI